MNRAIAYIRVSSAQQVEEGVSLDAQKAAVMAYAASKGLTLVDVVADAGVSAGTRLNEREGGRRLVEMIRTKRVDVVLATRLDRIFRNAADCLMTADEWSKKKVSLILLDCGGMEMDTSNPISKMVLTFMAGIAEHEKSLISARTKAALAHKRALGLRTTTHPPFGFCFQDGLVVEHEQEQQTLAQIRELRSMGFSSAKIANALNARGTPSRGTRWHTTTIQRIAV